jgi:diguanylate cyclase (GGDEF)-like protein/PAS domain S-box-containing protein
MVLSGGTLTPALPVRRANLVLAILAVATVAFALLVGAGSAGGPAVRVLAAAVASGFALQGWQAAAGRERRVRAWILFAVLVWLASEVARLVGSLIGISTQFAEISVVGLAVGAVGTYVAAAHGRMRTADEIALYLDAAALFFGLAGTTVVIGAGWLNDSIGAGILVHAAFFVGVLGATLLLDVSTRVPLAVVGPWEMLAGIGLGAAGYLGLLTPATAGPLAPFLHLTVAAGALLVGHGGGRWTAAQDNGSRYRRVAGWVRAVLPLGSAVLIAIAVVVGLVARPLLEDGWLRVGAGTAMAVVVMSAIARQTLLLLDRENVIRHERELADELIVAESQYRSVVERVPGVVYVAEAGQHGRWHFVSPKIEDMLGFTAEEWIADPTLWLNRMHPADRERMILAETGEHERVEAKGRWEYRLIARDGHTVWVLDDEAVVSRDVDGRPSMVQGILVDISDRKDLEDQLRHQALHDPLTLLPNRVLFVDRLTHALVRRGRSGTGLAVLFVDLDDFKAINDTLGHAVGDELLRLVGARLAGVLRAEDTACRLGGDEFAFLVEDAPADRVDEIADRILRALAEPFALGDRSATLSASIGVATRDRLSQDQSSSESADELLRDADTAMYSAKALGKGRVCVFDRRMEEPLARRRQLRPALEDALTNDELFLEYQPIVDMRTRSTVGLEALVRWTHPQLGRMMPADFVPLAEQTGLIGPLGDWVLRRACADLAGCGTLVSVNVSAHQVGSGELTSLVEESLRTSGLDPARLMLELTESSLASAGVGAETELERIQALGVRIALDDFGSGYSSLEYLGRLPIDILKIDRSLIERVHVEPQRQEVLRAIGHIAEKLGLETIVEGVELEAQRVVLLELGFRRAQGFFFSAAVPLSRALAPAEVSRAS